MWRLFVICYLELPRNLFFGISLLFDVWCFLVICYLGFKPHSQSIFYHLDYSSPHSQ